MASWVPRQGSPQCLMKQTRAFIFLVQWSPHGTIVPLSQDTQQLPPGKSEGTLVPWSRVGDWEPLSVTGPAADSVTVHCTNEKMKRLPALTWGLQVRISLPSPCRPVGPAGS